MRISNRQMKLLKKCRQSKDPVLFVGQEELAMADYLVSRHFLTRVDVQQDMKLFTITEEGKAYFYEFSDMKFNQRLSLIIAIIALVISVVSLLKK